MEYLLERLRLLLERLVDAGELLLGSQPLSGRDCAGQGLLGELLLLEQRGDRADRCFAEYPCHAQPGSADAEPGQRPDQGWQRTEQGAAEADGPGHFGAEPEDVRADT